MARILGSTGQTRIPLTDWRHLRVAPGAFASPATLPAQGWVPFIAPGLFAPGPEGRHAEGEDHWLQHRLARAIHGRLHFEGLATHCDVFIDGVLRGEQRSMFIPLALEGRFAAGCEITLRFHALDAALSAAPRKARWRPRMIEPNGLRYLRTTALGSMDGWTPEGRPTSPYRPIYAIDEAPAHLSTRDILECALASDYHDGLGRLECCLTLRPGVAPRAAFLTLAGQDFALKRGGEGRWHARLRLPGIAPWWPHSHGTPALHALSLTLDDTTFDLGATGFRRITIDRGADGRGFGLIVNAEPIFCRGAVWMTPDAARLPGAAEDYAALIALAREAGMNMLRIPGVGLYESAAFFAACDAAGILVMQDAMLANFDYPQQDERFCAAFEAEIAHHLGATQANPSLALLCGGSEVFQQAAMLGAAPETWGGPLFEQRLPQLVARHRPGLAYVANSPSGGALPFVVDEGLGHYFGVGAYRFPLEDARRAAIRFASECLAFANVPREAALMAEGIARDAGADWDFAQVRDHYAAHLFGAAAAEPARAHAVAEATGAAVMEATLQEWRRPASPTRGALVLMLSDLMPGAGWGLIDVNGRPKAAYYGFKRACQPLHLGLTDEGVNGLHLHLVNETATPFAGEIHLVALREGHLALAQGKLSLRLEPRESRSLSAFAVLGGFFDLNHAYRFGALEHDSVHLRLIDQADELRADAFHFPDMAAITPHFLGLEAELGRDTQGWFLDLSSQRLARFVAIACEEALAEDQRFHLAPGATRRLRLVGCAARLPRGVVSALNASEEVRFGQ